jgi:hypothetical protein
VSTPPRDTPCGELVHALTALTIQAALLHWLITVDLSERAERESASHPGGGGSPTGRYPVAA